MDRKSILNLVVLHINILIFSLSGIFSKMMAKSINENGLFYIGSIIFFALIILSCGIYAIFWQQSLKHFDVNLAYSHRAVYNVWSLIWAVVIFREQVTIANIFGTILIIFGIVFIQGEQN